jgi:hypothetical protein
MMSIDTEVPCKECIVYAKCRATLNIGKSCRDCEVKGCSEVARLLRTFGVLNCRILDKFLLDETKTYDERKVRLKETEIVLGAKV